MLARIINRKVPYPIEDSSNRVNMRCNPLLSSFGAGCCTSQGCMSCHKDSLFH